MGFPTPQLLDYMYFTYPQVNLKNGLPADSVNSTCLAGAGTLVLEFGILSRLLGNPVYESYARRAVDRLWEYRSNVTGLLGTVYAFFIRFNSDLPGYFDFFSPFS